MVSWVNVHSADRHEGTRDCACFVDINALASSSHATTTGNDRRDRATTSERDIFKNVGITLGKEKKIVGPSPPSVPVLKREPRARSRR